MFDLCDSLQTTKSHSIQWFLLGIISRYRPKNGVKKRSHKTESNSKPMRPKGEKTQRQYAHPQVSFA